MARPLNTKIIDNFKADPSKRLEIPDGALVGLYLVVQPSGSKSFAVRYRAAGRPTKITLGPHPRITLGQAREAAREALRIVSEGGDPSSDRVTLAKLKGIASVAPRNTFEAVLHRFIAAQQRKGRRSAEETRRILEKDALPYWRGRAIESITPADIVERIEAILERGRPVAASRFRAWCSKLFSYAVGSQLRPDNPVKGVEDPVEPKSLKRDRRLGDEELVALWRAAEQLGYPFGPMTQLLILTGQRLREVAEAQWSEFDLGAAVWTIPATRAKNGAEHCVALADATIAILAGIPRTGRSQFVFSTNGASAVSGFSKAKARLDKIAADVNGGTALPHWRLHDLRRTFVSGCARVRIPAEVVERAINHVSESFGGVRGVYNVHAYYDERRGAMESWARFVAEKVACPLSHR